VISLKSLADKAQAHQDRWDDLPDELRHPGGITRIIGYHVDPARQDILIVGTLDPTAPPIALDDLIVGLRAVYRDHETPFCSLDPDPDDFSAPQHVRLGGVPDDSSFARIMIEADYAMKKLMFGILEPGTADFESLAKILRRPGTVHNFTSRAWFYPVQPARGDIQISTDRTTVLFLSNVEVLSEEMVHCREGLVGTGGSVSTVETAAESFTQCYPAIAAKYPVFGQLKGLFDVAFLGTLWTKTDVKCEALDRLVALPYRHQTLPKSYPAVTVQLPGPEAVTTLSGGVELRLAVNPDLFLTLDDPAFAAVAERSPDEGNGAVARPLEGVALEVQDPLSPERALRRHLRTAAFGKLEAGDAAGAVTDLTTLLGAEPDDPTLLSTRAFACFMGDDFVAARADANAAKALDPENLDTLRLASTVLFLLDKLEGHPDQALAEINETLGRDPANVRSRLLRGDALAVLGQKDGARTEFKLAIAKDPTRALPYIQLGVLELSDGWIVKGMKLLKKAERVAKLSHESAAVKAALALAEVENAALGDVDQRFASGVSYAKAALGDPACDPESKILASSAIMAVAVYHNDWEEVEECLQRVAKIVPWNPELLLAAAEAAHEQKRDDLARSFLARARRIAPENPAVKAALPGLTEQ